jgi:hypothetical protein
MTLRMRNMIIQLPYNILYAHAWLVIYAPSIYKDMNCVFLHPYIDASIHTHIQICVCTYMSIRINIHTNICNYVTIAHKYICNHMRTHTHIQICVCTYISIRINIHTNIYNYITIAHKYICNHMRTHTSI